MSPRDEETKELCLHQTRDGVLGSRHQLWQELPTGSALARGSHRTLEKALSEEG